jgi:hypothetical protein
VGAHEGCAGLGPSRAVRKAGGVPKKAFFIPALQAKKGRKNQSEEAQLHAIDALAATLRIAPQLRAQGHVEARRQKVVPIRGHAAKDRLAVRRDAAARRQGLAAGGVGAAEVLDLLSRRAIKRASLADRCLVKSPLPETDPEHSEPGGAGVRGREGVQQRGPSRAVRKAGGSNSLGVTNHAYFDMDIFANICNNKPKVRIELPRSLVGSKQRE